MTSEQRREKIAALIERSSSPLTREAYLAKLYNVSRQIIIQDIAILRAAGLVDIVLPQGYIMPPHRSAAWADPGKCRKTRSGRNRR